MVDMDQLALQNSEVFKEFSNNFVDTEKSEEMKLFAEFDQLQDKINNSPKLKEAIATLQNKILSNPEYKDSLHPDFVSGLLLIKIEE